MPPALVKAGAVAASLSPSFGQATASGNLLVAFMYSVGSAASDPFGTSSPGWVKIATTPGEAYNWASMWCKPGCGTGETAPVFTDSGGGPDMSVLAEFSGAATSSPVDKYGAVMAYTTDTSTAVPCSAPDTAAGDLIVAGMAWQSGGAPLSATMTDSAGAAVTAAVFGSTSSPPTVLVAAYGVAGSSTGASDDTAVLSASSYVGYGSGVIASFKAAAGGPAFLAAPGRRRGQAVNRASTY